MLSVVVQWAHGFDIKFGLYRWDPGMGSKREMRAATPLLAGIYKELPDQVPTSVTLHARHSLRSALHTRGEHAQATLQPELHQPLQEHVRQGWLDIPCADALTEET